MSQRSEGIPVTPPRKRYGGFLQRSSLTSHEPVDMLSAEHKSSPLQPRVSPMTRRSPSGTLIDSPSKRRLNPEPARNLTTTLDDLLTQVSGAKRKSRSDSQLFPPEEEDLLNGNETKTRSVSSGEEEEEELHSSNVEAGNERLGENFRGKSN